MREEGEKITRTANRTRGEQEEEENRTVRSEPWPTSNVGSGELWRTIRRIAAMAPLGGKTRGPQILASRGKETKGLD